MTNQWVKLTTSQFDSHWASDYPWYFLRTHWSDNGHYHVAYLKETVCSTEQRQYLLTTKDALHLWAVHANGRYQVISIQPRFSDRSLKQQFTVACDELKDITSNQREPGH